MRVSLIRALLMRLSHMRVSHMRVSLARICCFPLMVDRAHGLLLRGYWPSTAVLSDRRLSHPASVFGHAPLDDAKTRPSARWRLRCAPHPEHPLVSACAGGRYS